MVKERNSARLCLFEATMDGVLLFDLQKRLRVYLQDTKIAVRRLEVERNDKMMEALYTFIEQVKGRPYKRNPLELLRALRAAGNSTDNMGSVSCSQLVVAAYQAMGLLSPHVCSNNYLPADLARPSADEDPRAVKLLQGNLGPLLLVPSAKSLKLDPQNSRNSITNKRKSV